MKYRTKVFNRDGGELMYTTQHEADSYSQASINAIIDFENNTGEACSGYYCEHKELNRVVGE